MTENEIYEAEIEHLVCCWDPNDSEYMSSVPITESVLKQNDLKEGDEIQYTIDN